MLDLVFVKVLLFDESQQLKRLCVESRVYDGYAHGLDRGQRLRRYGHRERENVPQDPFPSLCSHR